VTLIYFMLNYFLLASLMAGIGAVVGAEQESRQVGGIISLIVVIPFFFFSSFISDPNGTAPLVLSLIPLTAPISVILRMSFGTIPAWQLALSLAILLISTIIVAWGSGRVFRWALLMYGKRPTPRELLRAIRGSSQMGTVAASQEGVR
jgi:ABC-2 type transport system permease protein